MDLELETLSSGEVITTTLKMVKCVCTYVNYYINKERKNNKTRTSGGLKFPIEIFWNREARNFK